jgi:hypothetical protein
VIGPRLVVSCRGVPCPFRDPDILAHALDQTLGTRRISAPKLS